MGGWAYQADGSRSEAGKEETRKERRRMKRTEVGGTPCGRPTWAHPVVSLLGHTRWSAYLLGQAADAAQVVVASAQVSAPGFEGFLRVFRVFRVFWVSWVPGFPGFSNTTNPHHGIHDTLSANPGLLLLH